MQLNDPLQSNRMFSCKQHCNIVPQYCNFDRKIALSNLQPTRTNYTVEIHKRFVNKASDWIIRKREAPIQLLRLFDCSCRLQIAQSNLPVKIAILWDNIAIVARKRTSGLTVSVSNLQCKFYNTRLWRFRIISLIPSSKIVYRYLYQIDLRSPYMYPILHYV
jgi:hypothetical protein